MKLSVPMSSQESIAALFHCPEDDRVVYLAIICAAVLTSLLIVANPSFFSHDEWDKYDHVVQHGLTSYLREYLAIRPGAEFGVPVRPVSFFIQGLVAPYMYSYPVLVHLVDAMMHGLVAVLLFAAVRRMHESRQFAWISALIFLVSPLAAFSVAWPAALMDRLYVLFGLLAFIASHAYIVQRRDTYLAAVLVASAMAILSKETGFILPAVLLVFPLLKEVSFRDKRLWTAFVAWSTPILLFLLYRSPALMNSLGGTVSSPYSASWVNIPDGLGIYAIYPFLWAVTEAHVWLFQPATRIWIAGLAHISLLVLIWRLFSFRILLIYLGGYFLFLVPVLPIAAKGAQYLYGSALAMSLALAALMTIRASAGRTLRFVVPGILLIVLTLHTFSIQREFYRTGICVATASKTIESVFLGEGNPAVISIAIEAGAPGHVLQRFATGRQIIGANSPLSMQVIDASKPESSQAKFAFNTGCVVYKRRL